MDAHISPGADLGVGSLGPFCVIGQKREIGPWIEDGYLIRSHTIIYPGVQIGINFQTGHYCLIRGDVKIGDNVKVGSYSSIEGKTSIGDGTVIRGRIEVPSVTIGKRCQIYIMTTFFDTPNPPDGPLLPPVIEDDVVLCGDVRVLGGVTVGHDSYVCAGTFVINDVPPYSYVKRDGTIRPRRA